MAGLSLAAILPKIQDPDLEYKKYLNFLVCLRDRRRNAATVSAKPFEVTADPSTACHLHCPYCSTGNRTIDRAPMRMTPEVHDNILKNLGDELFIVWYFSCGEPFLNKDLPDFVAQSSKKGIFTAISSNLSVPLTDAKIDAILKSGLGLLCVSLDGACEETYSRYRRGGKFHLVLDNLKRLVRRKRELGLKWPLLEWRFLAFQHNEHEIDAVRKMAAEIGVDSLEFFPGAAPPDAPQSEVQLASRPISGMSESGPALDAAFLRRDTRLRRNLGSHVCDPPREVAPNLLRAKCDWLYYGGMIYPDGRVGPCCVAGDRKDDFGELSPQVRINDVWNNARYQTARKLFTGGKDRDIVCSRCTHPPAMDFQFQKSINGIFANAPDWALAAIAASPDMFLHEIDIPSVPCAAAATKLRPEKLKIPCKILKRLREDAEGDSPWHDNVREIFELLQSRKVSWWRKLVA